ncbi:DUF2651 domain-containing protein [Bacillus mangrovi]|uniref:DUF2651 domain-containing protein n=1 Tax=Metabacillus mangrovi TaxID=1491830 RepID=A0A7X2S3Q2_9BACI|nr:DUF2651 family protein [Metabacillus mangrovi]MTH53074.1 DUF2651 domain-containing protein [Metabacillus mangrovi]
MEYAIVLFIIPFAVMLLSLAGSWLVRKVWVMPVICLAALLILTITVFNDSFVIWVSVYTVLSILVSYFGKTGRDLFEKHKKEKGQ